MEKNITPKMKGDYRMITASEARDNVKMYKEALYTTTKNALQPVLKTISKGIEFHSRAGLSETMWIKMTFTSNVKKMQLANVKGS